MGKYLAIDKMKRGSGTHYLMLQEKPGPDALFQLTRILVAQSSSKEENGGGGGGGGTGISSSDSGSSEQHFQMRQKFVTKDSFFYIKHTKQGKWVQVNAWIQNAE